MPLPLISIIVPIYNVEAYLRECLDSVLAQSYSNWECICVNDGSSDHSPDILDEYAHCDSRFVVIHQLNSGVSRARNVGLNTMRGEYFTFLDGDDIYTPDALEHYIYLAIKHQSHLVEASAYLFSTDGQVCWADWEEEWNQLKDAVYPAGQRPSLMTIKPYIWNALYHRQLWENSVAYFSPQIRIAEDFLFKTRLLKHLNSCYIQSSKRIYGYRKGRLNSAMSHTQATRMADDELAVYRTVTLDWLHAGYWREIKSATMELLYQSAQNRLPHMSKCNVLYYSILYSIRLFQAFTLFPNRSYLGNYMRQQKQMLKILWRKLS